LKEKVFFVDSQNPLSLFSMLKYAPWTLNWLQRWKWSGCRNVTIGDCKTHVFNETGFFWRVSAAFVHDCRLKDFGFFEKKGGK